MEVMPDEEFDYWFALHFLGVIGYEAEDKMVARLERRIAFGQVQHPNGELDPYRIDPFARLPEEDEEFMEMVEDGLAELKRRVAAGDFDHMKRNVDDGDNTAGNTDQVRNRQDRS